MSKKAKNYHETASYYGDMLSKVRDEIINAIRGAVDFLGGRVCFRHYHEWEDMDRYTFFEVDGDGYGRELFLDTLVTDASGEIGCYLHDSEDCYNPYWELSDFNASDALCLLQELEDIIEIVGNGKVVTDYDPDYDPDED